MMTFDEWWQAWEGPADPNPACRHWGYERETALARGAFEAGGEVERVKLEQLLIFLMKSLYTKAQSLGLAIDAGTEEIDRTSRAAHERLTEAHGDY